MENTGRQKFLRTHIRVTGQYNFGRISLMSNHHVSLRTERYQFGKSLLCLGLCLACLQVVVSDLPEGCTSEDLSDCTSLKTRCEESLPECECDFYNSMGLLTCKNISNFEMFAQKLSDGSLFEVNTTFNILLSGHRVLPRGFLNGLIVQKLTIDDIQTEHIENTAFDGTLKLKVFTVKLSSIKEIPEFQTIRGSLEILNLENSLLTSISGDRLKNLTNLRRASFAINSIRYVSPDAFQGTDNLLSFDMSYNQLRSLPPNLFNSWKNLKRVSLSFNLLLHVDQLFAMTHPMYIFLDHNNLTDLDSIIHPDMHELKTLQLSYNPISMITDLSFNGKINKARFLYLDHCLIREFKASHFQNLSRLITLDLSHNLIEDVANQSIQFGGLDLEIEFTGNNIKEFNVSFTRRIRSLFLEKNLLTSLGQILRHNSIVFVSMAENRIRTLGPEDFRNVGWIESINLQRNWISEMHPSTFISVRRDLKYLDLSRNQIRSLQGSVRYLSMLISLNLTGNKIESFEEGEFRELKQLRYLHLDGNLITTLGNELRDLYSLRSLIVSNDRISTLKREQIPENLKLLYLEGNPIKCDCQLLPFLHHLNSSSIKTDTPICTPTIQITLLPPAECPDGCNCSCAQNEGDHFMSVDCSSAGLTELPHLFTNESGENITSVAIHLHRGIHFSQAGPIIIADAIGSLNLTDNHLRSLEGAHLPDRLSHLFLGSNDLHKPPPSHLFSLENLREVTLSGNPWSCDCASLPFKEWMHLKSEILVEANETRCGPQSSELAGRLIGSLTNLDLCPGRTEFPASQIT
ncbi:protein toll-like isoform X1 [Argiope bruennichi]|uniref:protein toll-like isoform X1 n=1 Tax=Argiope bruennichi TaxID=94029 RepID=UPI002493E977|nr:protein toll-like isoform X1 [Argiope bruennichi]